MYLTVRETTIYNFVSQFKKNTDSFEKLKDNLDIMAKPKNLRLYLWYCFIHICNVWILIFNTSSSSFVFSVFDMKKKSPGYNGIRIGHGFTFLNGDDNSQGQITYPVGC